MFFCGQLSEFHTKMSTDPHKKWYAILAASPGRAPASREKARAMRLFTDRGLVLGRCSTNQDTDRAFRTKLDTELHKNEYRHVQKQIRIRTKTGTYPHKKWYASSQGIDFTDKILN